MKNQKITLYAQYIQNLCRRFHKIEFRHASRTQKELENAPTTIVTMIKHADTSYIDPIYIDLKEQSIHCLHVEAEPDDLPWYFDIKMYLETRLILSMQHLTRRCQYTVWP